MASFASTTVLPTCGGQRGGRCVARASAVAVAAPAAARTHYEVLGIGAGASRCEIKAAYRRLAREVHPDAAGGGLGDDMFIRLHAAYATLADPDERARYDRAVAVAAPVRTRSSWAAPAAAGFRPRRWETDQCW